MSNISRNRKRPGRALVLATIALALCLGIAAPLAAAPGINSTYQYFSTGNFAHMTANPVFRSLSYNQLIQLLESDGTFMILLGGAWCPNTQAVIGQINDVANEYGVKTIYNFDWRIDGTSATHLRDSKSPAANLYVDLVNKYLTNMQVEYGADRTKDISYTNKDGAVVAAPRLQVPFLFLYNKAAKDAAGKPAPIVASLEKMLVWEKDFQTNGKDDPAKIEAYKKEIRPLFDIVATSSGGKKVATKLAYPDDLSLFAMAYNARAKLTILDAKDAPWVIKTVGYVELKKLLESPGNYALLFGGPWCPNTQAVIKLVNQHAKKHNIDTVYMWDTRVDGNTFQLRDSKNAYANLYVDLINKYFPGIVVEYGAMRERDISYTDKDGKVVSAVRMQVPYVFTYNKDWKDAAGNPKPIGGQIELMYEWANIQPDFKDDKGGVGVNYKNYTAALDKLFSDFAAKLKK